MCWGGVGGRWGGGESGEQIILELQNQNQEGSADIARKWKMKGGGGGQDGEGSLKGGGGGGRLIPCHKYKFNIFG